MPRPEPAAVFAALGETTRIRLVGRLGEQSVEILREAGLSDAEIEALSKEGATVDGRTKI